MYNNEIIKYLDKMGITAVGFCDVKPLTGYADFILKEHQGLQSSSVYLDISHQNQNETSDWFTPLALLPTAKTIIVVLLPYNLGVVNSVDRKVRDQGSEVHASKLSQGSIFEDYHHIMKRNLDGLRNYITVNFGKESLFFCDFGPFNDKAIALKSGLLKVGRNSLLYHPKYGSRFYIGYLITELECETNTFRIDQYNDWEALFHPYCSHCGRCQASCPNKAIERFGHLKSAHCISFLTQSKEWTLEEAIEGHVESLSDYAYGCDICQKVCPLNGISLEEFAREPLVPEKITIEDLILTKKEFKERYGKTSVGWIGKSRLERNIRWNEYKHNTIKEV